MGLIDDILGIGRQILIPTKDEVRQSGETNIPLGFIVSNESQPSSASIPVTQQVQQTEQQESQQKEGILGSDSMSSIMQFLPMIMMMMMMMSMFSKSKSND
jgi:hypothetical protein